MKVEIWADVICPWCGLGQRRLELALDAFGHRDAVTLVHRSFQLDPGASTAPRPVRAYLRAKLGMSDAQVAASSAHIEGLARAAGLVPYVVGENTVGNTHLAHEMLKLAAAHGREDAAWAAIYRAYFGERRPIFSSDDLVPFGAELGLDPDALRTALEAGTYRRAVDADAAEAHALGASGVPFVVIDRAVAVPGAQSVEVFRGALEDAWARRGRP